MSVYVLSLLAMLAVTGALTGKTTSMTWQDLLVSDTFLNFIQQCLPGPKLDILISSACASSNLPVLSLFSRKHDKATVFYTLKTNKQTRMTTHYGNDTVTHKGLVIVCDKASLRLLTRMRFDEFAVIVALVPEQVRMLEDIQLLTLHTRHWVVTLEEDVAWLTPIAFDKPVVNSHSIRAQRYPLWNIKRSQCFPGQVALKGRTVRVDCANNDACGDTDTQTLFEVLLHSNATVTVLPKTSMFGLTGKLSAITGYLNLALNDSDILVDPSYSGKTVRGLAVPSYINTFSLLFFSKAPQPYPKEVIIVLPLTVPVWVCLLATIVLAATVSFLIAPPVPRRLSRIVFFFLSSVVTHCCDVPKFLLQKTASKLVVTCWCILILVVTTGYKASLTSFLKDVPLREGIHNLESLAKLSKSKGILAICMMTDIHIFEDFYGGTDLGVHVDSWPQCWSVTLSEPANRCVYVTRESGLDLLRAILPPGYIPSRETLFNFAQGPKIRPMSLLGAALKAVLTRSLEAGLFVRARSLSDYKQKWQKDREPLVSGDHEALTTSDLRPYFVVWALGLFLAFLVVLAERVTNSHFERVAERQLQTLHLPPSKLSDD